MANNTGLNPVRVIAKIRGFTDPEAESASWVSVHKPKGLESDTVTISFPDQASSSRKEFCELDYCYEQNEGNDTIFSREVKPLVSGVFDGRNATIIACGARGSGKTHVIQGSDKKPGLAVLAMAEILSMAEETGKSITISLYEIIQDHVYDLLDPKRPAVLVLDNGQGKIQLKGLSQVPVKSISEFQKLYLCEQNSRKPMQKIATEVPRRSHKGLIVHILSPLDSLPVGKMNFVDLAGYEDARRKSTGSLNLVESTKLNKSIHALHNVVYALNANESHVPYRESKLTRMLQDCLGGKNIILMLTCLNPSFCQDSMYMASLASRYCQGSNRVVSDTTKKPKINVASNTTKKTKISAVSDTTKTPKINLVSDATKKPKIDAVSDTTKTPKINLVSDTTKKTKSSARPMVISSHKSQSQLHGSVSTTWKQFGSSVHSSMMKAKSQSQLRGSVSTTWKQFGSSVHCSVKKADCMASAMKGRKLFVETSHLTKSQKISKKASSSSDDASVAKHSPPIVRKEASSSSDDASVAKHSPIVRKEVSSSSDIASTIEPSLIVQEEESTVSAALVHTDSASVVEKNASLLGAINLPETTIPDKVTLTGGNVGNGDYDSLVKKDESPPLSARLQDISNNLKLLLSTSKVQACTDIVELKKPQPVMREACTDLVELETPQPIMREACTDLVKLDTPQPITREACTDFVKVDAPQQIMREACTDLVKLESPQPIMREACTDLVKLETPQSTRREACTDLVKLETPQPIRREACTDIIELETPQPIMREACTDIMVLKTPQPIMRETCTDIVEVEPKTPLPISRTNERREVANFNSPWETLNMCSSGVKNSLVHEYIRFLNTASKEELKRLKGIGEKRATYIVELREDSPEPFKSLDDLKDIGLSAKQIKGIMKKEVGELFD